MIRNPLFAGALALAAVVAASPVALGQTTYTWTGGGANNNWSTAANWTASAGSPPPVSNATTTLIVLDGTTRLTNSLDLLFGTGGGLFDTNSLSFATGAGSFVVNPTGTAVTALRIGTGGLTVSSNNNQTFAAPLALSAAQTWANNGTGTFLASGTIDIGSHILTVGGTGAVTFGGVVSGTGGLTKTGANTFTLSGANSYTGVTTISGGVLSTTTLANGGANSGIGASPSAAGNLVLNGGTLRYTGGAVTTDRQFTLTQSGGTLEANGTGAVTFGNTGAVAFTGTGARTLTLAGTNTGANTLAAVIGDEAGGATSVTKTGAGTWALTGANTYTGPTTVTGGSLAVNRVSAVTTPLGTGPIALNGGTLSFRGAAANPLTITAASFTQDVVMSTTDFNSAIPFGITSPIDGAPGIIAGNVFAFYEFGTVGNPAGTGLPADPTRSFVSAANPLTTYQLQPYDAGTNGEIRNNALFLSSDVVSSNTGTLNIAAASQGQYQTVSVLVTGGGGAASFNAVLRFSDNSTTAVTGLTAPDWFNVTPFAITNLGRVTTDAFPTGVTGNPRLYPVDIGLSAADQAKTLTGIEFTRTGGGRLSIFGVSGAAPGGQASYANPVSVTADSTVELVNTGALTLGPLSIGTNTLATAGPANSFLTFPSVGLTGNPTFNVANQTLSLGPLDFGSAARTVTKSGVGTLVLGGAAANATATNQLTVTAGTANVTNATALGTAPNLSVTGGTANLGPVTTLTNATVTGGTANLGSVATIGTTTVNGGTLALGGATATGRLTGTGGTVALGANALTVGTANQNDSFGGVFTGTGSVVKVGTGTETLTSPGSTFSGGLTVNAGRVEATRPGTLGTGAVTLTNGTSLVLGAFESPLTVTGFGGNGAGWNLQGGAGVASDVLTLTTAANGQTRSAWHGIQVPTGPFTASFRYSRTGGSGDPADGVTFTLQNQSATALGGGGGGLGYGGITPSASLQINIFNPNGRGIAYRTNGAVAGGGNYTATTPVDIFNSGAGNEVLFNLVYDGTNLNVSLTQGTNTFNFPAQALNLTTLVGPQAYIGFTGATGGQNANQAISTFGWNFTGTSPPAQGTYTNAVIIPASASSTINPKVTVRATTFAMGALSMGAGATLNLQPETGSLADTAYNLTLGATTLAGEATFNVANNGTGVGTLTLGALGDGGVAREINKEGPGTLTLAGAAASLVTGTVLDVNAGTLRVTNATALGNLATVDLAASTNLSLGANQTVGALIGTGNIALNGNTLTIGSTNNLGSTFGGVIANGTAAGGLTKAGTGTLILTGANTYTGATTLAAGVLQVGAASALGNTSAITFSTGSTGTLRLNGNNVATGALSGPAGTVENANATAATLTAGASNTDTTFGGVIQNGTGGGALSLVKVGTGSLTLAGANTYSGGTTVNGGTLRIGSASALGTGNVSLGAATLSTTGIAASTAVTAGTLQVNGSTIALGSNAHTLTFSGLNSSTTGLTVTGWSGAKFSSGTAGQLFLGGLGSDPNTTLQSWLSNVTFAGVADTGPGGFFLATGTAGQFQLVPVPEPGTVLGIAAAGLVGLGALRRRFRGKTEATVAA